MSRLVVGILLHFCVPAYLLACLLSAFAIAPVVTRGADVLPRMVWTGAWFVPVFMAITAVSAAVAALIDRRTPLAADDAATARGQVSEAARALTDLHDRRIDRALARMEANAWDWGDPRDQRVAADLASAARTFAAAAASAAPDHRAAVLALAAESVERLAAAGAALAAERGRLDEGDARTVAGYLAARYSD